MNVASYTEQVMMLSDRELLELVARSLGMTDYHYAPGWDALAKYLENDPKKGFVWSTYWNPLVDVTDAMNLASAQGLVVDFSRPSANFPYEPPVMWIDELMDNTQLVARSIVLAVAIRQYMKEQESSKKGTQSEHTEL